MNGTSWTNLWKINGKLNGKSMQNQWKTLREEKITDLGPKCIRGRLGRSLRPPQAFQWLFRPPGTPQ